MSLTKNPGRFAGLLYLVGSIPGWFALEYVPGKLLVDGNATATANNIAARELLFRLGIAADLICQTLFIFVALALYNLFKGVNQRQAVLMVILLVVSVPIAFLNELNAVAALVLVRGADFLSVFDKPQRDALAMLFLNLRGGGIHVAEVFWGLWLVPLGMLLYRLGLIPRILGVLLMAACFAYLANSFTRLLLPVYADIVYNWISPLLSAELWLILWLLIKGANPKPLASRATVAAAD